MTYLEYCIDALIRSIKSLENPTDAPRPADKRPDRGHVSRSPWIIVVIPVCVLLASLSIYPIWTQGDRIVQWLVGGVHGIPEDVGISHVYQTHADPALPDSIFGQLDDDAAKPRLWMDTTERGAEAQLKSSPTSRNAIIQDLWILSKPFDHAFPPFTAYLYTGTAENHVVFAYLVHSQDDGRAVISSALDQVPNAGSDSLVLFSVPKSAKGDRLLVFLAMTNDAYVKITHEPKFDLRSQPAKTASEVP
jgi:hypothetical protein